MKRLRVLVLSELNNPDWISVPLVGHNHSAALARDHDVTLVTRDINRDAILRRDPGYREVVAIATPRLDVVYDWIFEKVFKGDHGRQALTAVRVPYYLAFEWFAWRRLRRRLAAREFDVVLRLTPVSPVIPSLIATRLHDLGVPFVIGPVNGGLPWPQGYEAAERQKEWISRLRFVYRALPYIKSTYQRARAIIAGSSQTWSELSAHRERLFFIPENGVHVEQIESRAPRPDDGPLELLFVGRLVPYKACDLALQAAAPLLEAGRAHFTIVGEGPERERLDALIASLGIGAHVRFTGQLTHAQAMAVFARADVLVFPSVREFGGGVVFEALASGCVPVVADYGGPGDIVTTDIGYKIPLQGEARSREGFTRALEELDADRPRLAAMSAAGQRFARERLSWNGKARLTSAVLAWASGNGERPDLEPPPRPPHP